MNSGDLSKQGAALWPRLTAVLCLAALAWLSLGPGQAAWRVSAGLPAILPAGEKLALNPPTGDRAKALVSLDMRCGAAESCAGLELETGPQSQRLKPGQKSADRITFGPLYAGQPVLVNTGGRPAKIESLWWENSAAHNSGFPRFSLLWSPATGPSLSWPALVVLMFMGAAFQFAGPTRGRPQPWIAALPSILGLAGSLLSMAGGKCLVLGWDAFLLMAAIGPLGLRLGQVLLRSQRKPTVEEGGRGAISSMASLGLLLLALAAAWLLVPQPPAAPSKVGVLVERLRQVRPDYIIMGNSMAGSRINEKLLGRLAGGARVFDLHRNQSYSTSWYLTFKNVVAASGAKPKVVFLFFSNARITNPWRGSAAVANRAMVASLSRSDEPVVQRIVHGRGIMHRELLDMFEPFYSLEWYGKRGRAIMGEGALRLAQPVAELTGFRISEIRRVWDRVANYRFRLSRLKASARGFRTLGFHQNLDFHRSLSESFLPEIITLARQKGIKLVLVRIQSRPNPDGTLDRSPAMDRYVRDLSRYAAAQGVGFHDFTGHKQIGPHMYGNRDHIARKYQDQYTRLFYETLRRYFQ